MTMTCKLLRVQCEIIAGGSGHWQLEESSGHEESNDDHHNGNDLKVAKSTVHNNCWSWQEWALYEPSKL